MADSSSSTSSSTSTFSDVISISTWSASQVASHKNPGAVIAAIWTKKPVGVICLFQRVEFSVLFHHKEKDYERGTTNDIVTLSRMGNEFGIGEKRSGCLVTWDSDVFNYVGDVQPGFTTTTNEVIGTPIVILQHRASGKILKVASVLTFTLQGQRNLKAMCVEADQKKFSNFAHIIGGDFDMASDRMKWASGTHFPMKLVGDPNLITCTTTPPQMRSFWFLINSKLEFVEEQVKFEFDNGTKSPYGMVTMTVKLQ